MITKQRLRKLRKMSLGEIATRLRERARHPYERLVARQLIRNPSLQMAAKVDARRLLGAAQSLVPGTQSAERSALQSEYPNTYEAMAEAAALHADSILSEPQLLLGHPYDFGAPIDWHRDPRTDYQWPQHFYADITISPAVEGVDVKYVWELGRQQYVAQLAQGWLLTHNDIYALRARDHLISWIQSNPVYRGIHWTSGLELAMRAISWIWTVAALAEWEGWRPEDFPQLTASLIDHAIYLEHHLSLYSSPYNHLIGEATALYLIALVLEQLPQAAGWQRSSRNILTTHAPRQFYRDGFCVEQATGYHFYTLGFLSMAAAAARSHDQSLDRLETALHSAFRAGCALRQPNGRWPAIGDVDSARSIPVWHQDFWDFRSLCSLGAVLFHDSGLKVSGTDAGAEVYWLLGTAGNRNYRRLNAVAPTNCAVLRDSGYAVARKNDHWLLFDAGPIADGLYPDATPSTAHGHADPLQILLTLHGKPVLIDSGISRYFGDTEWSDYHRSPAAHNTLEIEGVSVARHAGRLSWSHACSPPQLDTNLCDDAWLFRGRLSWDEGVHVQRYGLVLPGEGMWVADWIVTDRPRQVRWYWQLPEKTVRHLTASDANSWTAAGPDILIAFETASSAADARIETAKPNAPVAWQAPGYGIVKRAQRIVCQCEVPSQLLAVTQIGETRQPFEVVVNGQSLKSTGTNIRSDAFRNQPAVAPFNGHLPFGAEILWRVHSATKGPITYLAGYPSHPEDPAWKALSGTGGWKAARHTAKPSLVR